MSRRRGKQGTHRIAEDLYPAEITDLAEDGRGVARVNNKVTFIHGALPGERVEFRYTRTRRSHDEGDAVSIERASPDRVTPPCPHFGVCGGCSLQHLATAAQVRLKQDGLINALRRIGNLKPVSVEAPVPGPSTGYRRKARLGARYVFKREECLVGFRERSSSFLATLDHCEILDPRVGRALNSLKQSIGRLSIKRKVPQIEVACAEHVALVIRVLETPSQADLEILRTLEADTGFDLYLQPAGPESITALTPGPRMLRYSPDGSANTLEFGPTDFVQVNEQVSQKSVQQALQWLSLQSGEQVLELFCGLGNFSIPLAAAGADLTAVEGEPGLVKRARHNANACNLDIEFHVANLFEPGSQAMWLRNRRYDAVLLDPPRAGAEAMMPVLAKLQAPRVLYVSCHPGTLARDAACLAAEGGYILEKAGVMDMFPHTTHIESMALFRLPSWDPS